MLIAIQKQGGRGELKNVEQEEPSIYVGETARSIYERRETTLGSLEEQKRRRLEEKRRPTVAGP